MSEERANQLTKANEGLSAFTDDLIEERTKKELGRKRGDGKLWYESAYQKSLTFYAYNSCNKDLFRTGFNHVQINLVYKRPRGGRLGDKYYKSGEAYYVMEYSQNIPKREGRLPSQYKDTPTAIQLPLKTFNPPIFQNNKIKVTYTDKEGKECNVLLGPCNTPEKEQGYKCPVRGVDFADDKDWEDKVTIWFKTRFEEANKFALLSGEWQGKEPTLEQALAPLKNPDTVSENPKIIELSKQVQDISEKTGKIASESTAKAEEHLADAGRLLEEHRKAMEEVDASSSAPTTDAKPPSEEEKIGGKKSRKKRRTKRRKSIRRKKGKKSKKH